MNTEAPHRKVSWAEPASLSLSLVMGIIVVENVLALGLDAIYVFGKLSLSPVPCLVIDGR